MRWQTVTWALSTGRCRWCGCTHNRPCAAGCGWADRQQTLCTECVPVDRALRSAAGRRALAEFLQEQRFTAPGLHVAWDRR